MLRKLSLVLVVLAGMLAMSAAQAQDRNLQVAKAGERRLALVIGNSDYKSAPLKNPVNDARAVAKALEATGFKVTSLENLSQRQMFEAVRAFGNSLKEDDVAMFYYAGHGMQVKDRNYLIPVEADIQAEDDIPYTSIDVNSVLDRMARARSRFNIVVLDACRNNPFARSFRSAASGLAQMEAPGGTLIAYATAPGKTASDGTGDNGLYTQHLLRHLSTPGLPVEIVFKRVREGVERDTKSAQTPWESSSLKGDFYFKPPEPVAQVASVAPAQQIVPVPGGVDAAARQREQDFAAELAFWDAVKASTSAADYKAYLDQYPNGRFAALARARVSTLEQQSAGSQQNREQAFWDSIKASNNAAEYEAYVAQYPNGQFTALARVRIASLKAQAQQQAQAAAQAAAAAQAQAQAQAQSQAQQQAAAEARENTFWESIRASNNTAEYEAYLAQFPKGRFAALANARIASLKQTAALAAAAAAAPKPAATPAPVAQQAAVQAPVQVAAIAPAAVAAPVQAPIGAVNPQALPAPGDRWVYQASGATRVPGNRLVFQVRDVSADGIAESLSVPGDTRVRSAVVLGGDAAFVQRSGAGYVIDFAPFLLAFNDPKAIKLPAELIRDFSGDGIFQPAQFRLVPRVVGTTQVKVPAGTFEAVHVSLQGTTTVRVNNGTLPGNAHFDIWYAPAAKRWVKLVARVSAGSSSLEDATLELAEFQLGTPGTANPLAAPAPDTRPASQVALVAPAAAAIPTQAPVGAINTAALPSPGDRWTYQASGANRVPGDRLVFQVRDVSADGIAESLSVPGDTRIRSAVMVGDDVGFVRRSGADFVIDFAPFLLAFNDPKAIKLPSEVLRDFPGDGIFSPSQFRLSPRVVGTAQVRVPAGTFEAIHVTLQGSTTVRGMNVGISPGAARYDIWYAPAAKRWVKLVSRVTAGNTVMEDATLELAEFRLGAPGSPNPLATPTPENRPATQVAAAAPVAVAAPAPASVATGLAALMPKAGDTWTYKFSDQYSRANDSNLVFTVKSVSPTEIEDTLVVQGKTRMALPFSFGPDWVQGERGGLPFQPADLAPYVQAFQPMGEGKEWKFTLPVSISANTFRGTGDMPFVARVERRERVTVPAGTFDAWKVVANGEMLRSVGGAAGGLGTFRMRFEVWFAPDTKRFVKYTMNAYAGSSPAESNSAELVSFKLN